MDLSYILNELGEIRSNYYNAVSPPVIRTSNFVFETVAEFRAAIQDEKEQHVYSRGNNPTVAILRQKMAALEETEDALIFGSGSGAISAAIMACVGKGDHVVCVKNPYSWTKSLLTHYLPRFGVEHTFVDGTDIEQIGSALQSNTKLLFLESPNTFTFELQDLSACAALARANGIRTIIDNSHASPIFQKPSRFGIDMIVHSASKYLNGHSDVVAGVLCGPRAMLEKIFYEEYMTLGAIISPADASLILRGLRTLPIRLSRVAETTKEVLAFLEEHPSVEQVLYPFSPNFSQYDLAKKQMLGCGGLLTIALKASSIEQVDNFVDRLERFKLGASWGGHESLVIPMSALYNLPGRADPHLGWNILRFYIGLEDAEYLIKDLASALQFLD